jgi:hypothetical protein
MANFQVNPWSVTTADLVTAAITSVTLNADGTVTLVTATPMTFNLTSEGQPRIWFTLIGVTNPLYNGFYFVVIGVSGGTVFTLIPQFVIPAGTAASAAGTAGQCLYQDNPRIDDLSWQNALAAATLDFRDRMGNIIWQATAANTVTGQQNRGKLYWVHGFTPFVLTSGIVLFTIN